MTRKRYRIKVEIYNENGSKIFRLKNSCLDRGIKDILNFVNNKIQSKKLFVDENLMKNIGFKHRNRPI